MSAGVQVKSELFAAVSFPFFFVFFLFSVVDLDEAESTVAVRNRLFAFRIARVVQYCLPLVGHASKKRRRRRRRRRRRTRLLCSWRLHHHVQTSSTWWDCRRPTAPARRTCRSSNFSPRHHTSDVLSIFPSPLPPTLPYGWSWRMYYWHYCAVATHAWSCRLLGLCLSCDSHISTGQIAKSLSKITSQNVGWLFLESDVTSRPLSGVPLFEQPSGRGWAWFEVASFSVYHVLVQRYFPKVCSNTLKYFSKHSSLRFCDSLVLAKHIQVQHHKGPGHSGTVILINFFIRMSSSHMHGFVTKSWLQTFGLLVPVCTFSIPGTCTDRV